MAKGLENVRRPLKIGDRCLYKAIILCIIFVRWGTEHKIKVVDASCILSPYSSRDMWEGRNPFRRNGGAIVQRVIIV